MSLFKRKDSSVYWVKITINGRTVQKSTGTPDKTKAQEFHDPKKSSCPFYAGAGSHGGGVNCRPRRYFTNAKLRIRHQRCMLVNCSAVDRSALKKAAIRR